MLFEFFDILINMNPLTFSNVSTNDTVGLIVGTVVFIISILVIRHVNKRRSMNASLDSENKAVDGLVNLIMYFLMFIAVGLSFYIPSRFLKNVNTIVIDSSGVKVQSLFNNNYYPWADVTSFVIKIVPDTSLHSISKTRYHPEYSDIVTKNNSTPLCYGLTSELSVLFSNGKNINIENDEIFQTKRGNFSVQSSPVATTISQLSSISKSKTPFTIEQFDTSDVEYTSCIQQGFDLNSVYTDLKSISK